MPLGALAHGGREVGRQLARERHQARGGVLSRCSRRSGTSAALSGAARDFRHLHLPPIFLRGACRDQNSSCSWTRLVTSKGDSGAPIALQSANGPESDHLRAAAAARRHRPRPLFRRRGDAGPASLRDRRADDGEAARLCPSRSADERDRALEFTQGMWDPGEPDCGRRTWPGASSTRSKSASRKGASPRRAAGPTASASYAFGGTAQPSGWVGLGGRSSAPATSRPGGSPPESGGAVLAWQARHAAAGRPAGRRHLVSDGGRSVEMTRDDWSADEPARRLPKREEVLDFWFGAPGRAETAAREVWFTQGRGVRRGTSASASARDRARAARRARRLGRDPASPSRRSWCSISSRATPFAATPALSRRRARASQRRAARRLAPAELRRMRAFLYLPFEHAEGLAMQDGAVRLLRAWWHRAGLQSILDYAHATAR